MKPNETPNELALRENSGELAVASQVAPPPNIGMMLAGCLERGVTKDNVADLNIHSSGLLAEIVCRRRALALDGLDGAFHNT